MNYSDSIVLIAAERSDEAAQLSTHAAYISVIAAGITLLVTILGILWYFVRQYLNRIKLYKSVSDKLALKMVYRNEDKPKFELVVLSLAKMKQNERIRFLHDNGITDIADFYEWVDSYYQGWCLYFEEYHVLKRNRSTP